MCVSFIVLHELAFFSLYAFEPIGKQYDMHSLTTLHSWHTILKLLKLIALVT